MKKNSVKIILASQSKGRKFLLRQIGLKFQAVPSSYEENMNLPLPPAELVKKLAFGKAVAVASKRKDGIVIGADTVVAYRGKILGKPGTPKKARQMLGMLNGKKHLVITGVAVIDARTDRSITFAETTTVYFRKLSSREIAAYIATGEPVDKAGAYGIQGRGAILVKKIEGDYLNIVGLPLSSLVGVLREFEINI